MGDKFLNKKINLPKLQTLSIKNSKDLRYFIGLESLKKIIIGHFYKIDNIEQIMDPTKIVELDISHI